ncbi:LemA family protein [Bowmanella pacifica]|uniref:LemA protein n=1 Tax=Bowmanella pacifica TaxID=502051 RepID=A0A917YXP6_9ALTE|nr:LemA family protein [Bowmanella pacifica]GGO69159.1 LemA protein [Bowmanella pacifica]
MTWTTIAMLAIPLVLLYVWYASIISRRNAAQEAFSGIDVQLKKRTDLIPNILKIAASFMQHEKTLLEDITRLRTEVLKASGQAAQSERFALEADLSQKMGSLLVAVENYPELKSQQNMLEAQRVYADVEEHISAARRSYNAAGKSYRDAIQIFPGNLIAAMLGLSPMPFFEVVEADRKPVDADSFLKS